MLSRLLPALAFLCFGLAPAWAQNAEEQAFIDYHTGRAIDAKCHFLRYFELSVIRDVELSLLDALSFTAAREAEKITDEEYLAAYNKLADMGKKTAEGMDCANEAAAAPYILKLREMTGILIYADLIIAFDGDNLTDEQKQAAQIYEAMISPLYGENWQGFVDYARGQAQFKFDRARQRDRDTNPFANLWDYDEYLEAEMEAYGMIDAGIYVEALRSSATRITDTILFDLSAADAGYRVRTEYLPDETALDTLVDADGVRQFELIDLPSTYETLERSGPVKLVFAVNQAGDIRIMTWGAKAGEILKNGSVTLLVNTTKLPPDKATDYSYMRSQEWLDAAEVFTAPRVEEPCIGGPCFALPGDVINRILAGSTNQAFRFFVSETPDPAVPAPNSNQIHTAFTYALGTWVLAKAGEDF